MANITDAAAVAFSNNRLRKLADLQAQYYNFAKIVVNEWFGQGVSGKVPNTTDQLADAALLLGDGRPVVTGAALTAIITRAQECIADFEASSNAKLNSVNAVAVNGTRLPSN